MGIKACERIKHLANKSNKQPCTVGESSRRSWATLGRSEPFLVCWSWWSGGRRLVWKIRLYFPVAHHRSPRSVLLFQKFCSKTSPSSTPQPQSPLLPSFHHCHQLLLPRLLTFVKKVLFMALAKPSPCRPAAARLLPPHRPHSHCLPAVPHS